MLVVAFRNYEFNTPKNAARSPAGLHLAPVPGQTTTTTTTTTTRAVDFHDCSSNSESKILQTLKDIFGRSKCTWQGHSWNWASVCGIGGGIIQDH